MSLTVTNSSNVKNAGPVASGGSRVEGSSPFTSSRALNRITSSPEFKSNFTLSASSRGASGVVTSDRAVRV